ncbi:hypothetical protein RO3G_10316 [Rhizopus delemar RA 99-880]|uniref:Uncharacterized protein n=1 Tax=Rhizopus delemar (strain RA 99-880 / ATCC MYA-4621 / FGSC 9543 / NRRL 43880) TaxID=246409 RepID=I1CAX6_RHIO9|nr:hypothetical protein RO3G_10316 [Rhizopus delemar RA 99-880]|eukprot:EIE85606.1 hypothetical protein RO3G_10316 [Rhizopus delemar RA 99-880]
MTLGKVLVDMHYLYKCYGFVENARTNILNFDAVKFIIELRIKIRGQTASSAYRFATPEFFYRHSHVVESLFFSLSNPS